MDTNKNVNKKGLTKAVILLIILVVIALGVGFAYARYITRLNGSTQAPIAQWNFKVTAGSSQSLNIDLADTRLANDTTEVDRTKVAPGTKGAIQLNVDATGSQVSLKYDIDLSLTQIPENLIFYYDEDMTDAMLKEDGKIHIDGYFGANDTNKTATKNLYWRWKLETGSTQAEIDSNDLLDSEWMGDSIILGIEATGKQVMDNPTTQYAVTFNLNGGTLASHGDSTQITKQVNYGETYGDLPTPKREGYTFAGWAGKNLFDEESILMAIPGATYNDGHYAFGFRKVYETYSQNGKSLPISYFKPDTQYTLTISGYVTDSRLIIYFNYTDGSRNYGNFDFQEEGQKILHSTANKTIKSITISYGIQPNTAYISHMQLEEGTTSTEYEPFEVVTSQTVVSEENNHTLTAIWEPITGE